MGDIAPEIDAPEIEVPDTQGSEGEYDLFADLDNALNPDDEVSSDESDGGDDDTSTEDPDVGDEVESEDSGETITVKVDGEEIEVTLDELKAGYSRQADYTKKTQALAREREQMAGLMQLAEALNANPEAAIAELARAFEVDFAGEPAELTDDFDPDDPVERKLRELEQWKAEMEADRQRSQREAQDRELQNTLDRIKADNDDPDMDEDGLLQFAVDNQIGNLQIAYELKTAREGKSKPKVNEPLERKRKAPPVETTTRRGAKKGTGRIESIADALRASMSEFDG